MSFLCCIFLIKKERMACDLSRKVISFMVSNDDSNLVDTYFELKQGFHYLKQVDGDEILCSVGKAIGRETAVECYFPTSVRAKKN
jgi:hypothetical protein